MVVRRHKTRRGQTRLVSNLARLGRRFAMQFDLDVAEIGLERHRLPRLSIRRERKRTKQTIRFDARQFGRLAL